MGSNNRNDNEKPAHSVTISNNYYIGETEVTQALWKAVMGQTPTQSGDQWDEDHGLGSDFPAYYVNWNDVQSFINKLNSLTGKRFRLPTEAEWEYAARGGTDTPYFFEGKPSQFTNESLRNRVFGADTVGINRYTIYANNSRSRTQEPSRVKANPFGLKNMLGNVMEYCADWYAEDAYSQVPDGAVDPKGPAAGTEHVVRGGCYSDDASKLRSAARAHTDHDAWLRTDPQKPKSIWWYSDVKGIGFRIVCEVPDSI